LAKASSNDSAVVCISRFMSHLTAPSMSSAIGMAPRHPSPDDTLILQGPAGWQ
jgi:hypothetical protein